MTCKICNIELTESDLSFCGTCDDLKEKWESYCQENNFYNKREFKRPGRRKNTKWKNIN